MAATGLRAIPAPLKQKYHERDSARTSLSARNDCDDAGVSTAIGGSRDPFRAAAFSTSARNARRGEGCRGRVTDIVVTFELDCDADDATLECLAGATARHCAGPQLGSSAGPFRSASVIGGG